jgi:2-polyprenyl-6-methoxyphenol hydroxylase-like FAD-dependent oxidoreductase
MNKTYDAIVVGARCAGAPTAMLLARQGHRVLLVDRATFPSDTLSTHVIHAPGVAALSRWGLLDQVVATGCPPIETYAYDFGPVTIRGAARPVDGQSSGYAPRRTVLDKILVDAATASGVEVREGFNVDSVLIEDRNVVGITGHTDGGERVQAKARIVIGADGKNSHVAKAVQAVEYETRPRLQYSYFTYFRDLPTDGMEVYIRPDGWLRRCANQRRDDHGRGGLALRRGSGLQGRRRGELPQDTRAGAGIRHARQGRDTHGAFPWRGGSRFLPYAVRPWLGSGG